MGFHKRRIDDDQVINIFKEYGYKGILNHYTNKVDVVITSGDLSEHVFDILDLDLISAKEKQTTISKLISEASRKKDIS